MFDSSLTQESIKILELLVPAGVEVACGTPIAHAIDDFDLDEIEDVDTLPRPTEVNNTYEENLGPDMLVSWQAFLKKTNE